MKVGETPCAFIALKPGREDTREADITGWRREHLAGFKVPKTVVFGELPKTATGKIQKYVLRDRAKALQRRNGLIAGKASAPTGTQQASSPGEVPVGAGLPAMRPAQPLSLFQEHTMTTYTAPLRDMRFVLHDVFNALPCGPACPPWPSASMRPPTRSWKKQPK